MSKSKSGLMMAAFAALSLGISGMSMGQAQPAQPQPGQPAQPGQPGQGRGNRGNFDPQAMRDRMNKQIQDALGANDDEFKVLLPRIEKVQTVQRTMSTRGGGFGGTGGGRTRGGQPGQPGGTTPAPAADAPALSPVAKAAAELKAAVDNKEAAPAEYSQKLAALRDAKEKAKVELATAQKELKELLTQRQEAVLVSMGMLD